MTNFRPFVPVTALIVAPMLAACGSSAALGPSGASLARIFDSAYVADSTAGHDGEPRALLEDYLALFADEGLAPVPVEVTIDGGRLPMLMMAAISYDTTATGAPADSLALIAGWTPDYRRYILLLTEAFTANGPRASRVRATSARLEALASRLRGNGRRIHSETSLDDLQGLAIVVDGQAAAFADSATGNIAWAGSGGCHWQHVPVSHFNADSAMACSRVSVTLDLAMHFPAQPGIDASLTHISFPSKQIPTVRLVGFNGF